MKIVGISGSLRTGSRNTALLEAAHRLMPSDIEFAVANIELPLFTDNHDAFPESVDTLRALVAEADGLFITTPEYNWNITTAMKNAIDWLSLGGAQSPLTGHVAAIAGVGGGRLGSVRAQLAMRTTLLHNRVWVVPGPEVLISPVKTCSLLTET
jgi:chromate reductase